MNLTEYNAMPDGDTKLAVRTAVTMGWTPKLIELPNRASGCVWVGHPHKENTPWAFATFPWMPFTDASIPYGLIGLNAVYAVIAFSDGTFRSHVLYTRDVTASKSKTHAILNAYCQADPMGHWAKFLKGE